MPSHKDPRTGKWFFRKKVAGHPRLYGGPFDKKSEADAAEDDAVEKLKNPSKATTTMPTFAEWFWGPDVSTHEPAGRFWLEHVLGGARPNKASERNAKRSIYLVHLRDFFGPLTLDKIDLALINTFRGRLRARRNRSGKGVLKEKTINNVLTVISKALNYAADVRIIDRAPKVGINKVEREPAEFFEFEQWAALINATTSVEEEIAVLLGGEHGLRIGEIRALRMADVDIRGRTFTIAQGVYEVATPGAKTKHDVWDTPKGRTRRTIPMSPRLHELLRDRIGAGYVVPGSRKGPDGLYATMNEARWMMERLGRRAGLQERIPFGAWHILRHTFATHCALLGCNVWSLNQWMGHKTLEETLLYTSLAMRHARELPAALLGAADGIVDPDKRILAMLSARRTVFAAAPAAGSKEVRT